MLGYETGLFMVGRKTLQNVDQGVSLDGSGHRSVELADFYDAW